MAAFSVYDDIGVSLHFTPPKLAHALHWTSSNPNPAKSAALAFSPEKKHRSPRPGHARARFAAGMRRIDYERAASSITAEPRQRQKNVAFHIGFDVTLQAEAG